jgi:purine-binding chemotaxis protein CheW
MQNAEKQAADTQQFLTFVIDDDKFGVEVLSVREIRGWSKLTDFPGAPSHMLGIINLRGSVVPIFDLKSILMRGSIEIDDKKVIIVINIAEQEIGIMVDAVSDIIDANMSQIKQSDVAQTIVGEQFIKGIIQKSRDKDDRENDEHANEMIVLLDHNRLLGDHVIEVLRSKIKPEAPEDEADVEESKE